MLLHVLGIAPKQLISKITPHLLCFLSWTYLSGWEERAPPPLIKPIKKCKSIRQSIQNFQVNKFIWAQYVLLQNSAADD